MALWSAYMPAGITLVMIVAPLVVVIGWRNLWLASACIAAVCALLLRLAVPATPMPTHSQRVRWIDDLATVICNPDCLVLAFAFFAFSCLMFSMTFALPLILTSVHGLSVGQAGLASAAMLAMATLGHVSCSLLLRSGIPIWVNVAAAFLLFGLAPFAVYTTAAPLFATMVFAALALGIGGLAPGALYAAAPQVAPHETSLPSTIGLLQQASNLGQFAGPLVIGVWVQNFGWDVVPAITVPAALFGFIAALLIRDVLSRAKLRPWTTAKVRKNYKPNANLDRRELARESFSIVAGSSSDRRVDDDEEATQPTEQCGIPVSDFEPCAKTRKDPVHGS
jgi:predicted MFS family arabinose efflux permease